MQAGSQSGLWLPLQTSGMRDRAVEHLHFQKGKKSALLERGGLNPSRLTGLPESVQTQASPAQLSSMLPEAGKWQVFTIIQAQSAGYWLVLSSSTLGLVFPMCKEYKLKAAHCPPLVLISQPLLAFSQKPHGWSARWGSNPNLALSIPQPSRFSAGGSWVSMHLFVRLQAVYTWIQAKV